MIALNRRRYMGGGALLYDAEVEYLEGTGTQYINTGFYPRTTNVNIKVENKFNKSTLSGDNCVLGARTGTTGDKGYKLPNFYNGVLEYQGLVRAGELTGTYTTDTDYTFIAELKQGSQNFYVNGVLNTEFSDSNASCNCGGNLYLFALNNNGQTRWQFKGKIYYCKIWEDDVLVRDYIPVRVGTTGYMYDRCTDTLYGNNGSGSFILGNDKTT